MVFRNEVLLKLQIAPNRADRSFEISGREAAPFPFDINGGAGGGGGGGGDGTLEPENQSITGKNSQIINPKMPIIIKKYRQQNKPLSVTSPNKT